MTKGPDERGIYFDSRKLKDPENNYVCWVDVMGTGNQMVRSLPIAANFIFKLQSAVLEAREETDEKGFIRLYPTIDGIYITSPNRWALQAVLNQAMCRCALTFLKEERPHHQFLVRGAIAFGPVYHGSDLDPDATFVMASNPQVRNAILMGMPMAQAHMAEGEAAPFGISIHESARAFSPRNEQPFGFIWLNWFRFSNPPIDPDALLAKMESYFNWQKQHTTVTGYRPERVEYHLKLAREFFSL